MKLKTALLAAVSVTLALTNTHAALTIHYQLNNDGNTVVSFGGSQNLSGLTGWDLSTSQSIGGTQVSFASNEDLMTRGGTYYISGVDLIEYAGNWTGLSTTESVIAGSGVGGLDGTPAIGMIIPAQSVTVSTTAWGSAASDNFGVITWDGEITIDGDHLSSLSTASLSITPKSSGADTISVSISQVPEPSTYAALAGALCIGIACWRRRKR